MGIEEAFANLAQTKAEERAEVTNLNETNKHLANQVDKQENNMVTKDAAINTM